MAQEIEKIVIRNEAAAFEILEAALRDEYEGRHIELDFKGWPTLALRFKGDGYESSITPDIAQALVDLQHALNRAYARTVHTSTNARGLTADERREISFKAKVSEGSSVVEVKLGDYAEKIAQSLAGKMESSHIVATVLGLAVIAGSTLSYKAWMSHQTETMKIEADAKRAVTLSQEETRRQEILVRAMAARPALAVTEKDFHDVRREILKSGANADKVKIQGVEMAGRDARALAAAPRTQAEDVQLNGHYTIQKVDFHNPDAYRITVTSTDGFGSFVATLRPESLTVEQQDRLKSGAWGRQRLHMQINGTRLRGEVTTAAIVGVEWPKAKPDQALAQP